MVQLSNNLQKLNKLEKLNLEGKSSFTIKRQLNKECRINRTWKQFKIYI